MGVSTTPIPGPNATKGWKWGYWALFNTNVFMRAWDKVLSDGVAMQYGWTVKVDVDAMFLPDRLAIQLRSFRGQFSTDEDQPGEYLINCEQWNSVQGPLEVLSRVALLHFGAHKESCYQKLDGQREPEDFFFQKCLVQIGAKGLEGFSVMQDWKCGGYVDCASPRFAVYHPMKKLDAYASCFRNAS